MVSTYGIEAPKEAEQWLEGDGGRRYRFTAPRASSRAFVRITPSTPAGRRRHPDDQGPRSGGKQSNMAHRGVVAGGWSRGC